MQIDDLVVLGRACPDQIENGRITICVGGHSQKHGFVRIYPTKIDSPLQRWSIVSVPVERNPIDTRMESWKIEGSKSEWDTLSDKIEVVGELKKQHRLDLVANLVDGCVMKINKSKRSLGIVKPKIKKHYFGEREDYHKGDQLDLMGHKLPKTKKNFLLQPRIKYNCIGACTTNHDQQLLEWGVYEWMRKHPENVEQVWENLQFFSEKHSIYFFVGNQVHRRNAFMVISVLRLEKRPVTSPFEPLKKYENQVF